MGIWAVMRRSAYSASAQARSRPLSAQALIAGFADGEFCSLSDEDAAHYAVRYAEPMPSYGSPDEPTQWEFHVL